MIAVQRPKDQRLPTPGISAVRQSDEVLQVPGSLTVSSERSNCSIDRLSCTEKIDEELAVWTPWRGDLKYGGPGGRSDTKSAKNQTISGANMRPLSRTSNSKPECAERVLRSRVGYQLGRPPRGPVVDLG